tara:strand:- start:4128 stop:4553 length:426 start_codon:yes stop_codon:yes gene_type:complete
MVGKSWCATCVFIDPHSASKFGAQTADFDDACEPFIAQWACCDIADCTLAYETISIDLTATRPTIFTIAVQPAFACGPVATASPIDGSGTSARSASTGQPKLARCITRTTGLCGPLEFASTWALIRLRAELPIAAALGLRT